MVDGHIDLLTLIGDEERPRVTGVRAVEHAIDDERDVGRAACLGHVVALPLSVAVHAALGLAVGGEDLLELLLAGGG